MQKELSESMQELHKAVIKLGIRTGATACVRAESDLDTTLWVDFLNADPLESRSMFRVYQKFGRGMDDLKYCLDIEGYTYAAGIENFRLASTADFMREWDQVKVPCLKLHCAMSAFVNLGGMAGDVRKMAEKISEDAGVPEVIFYISANRRTGIGIKGGYSTSLIVDAPRVGNPGFWLWVLLVGMVGSYERGSTARRCLAEDCRKYYIPAYRSRGQLYHSKSCQKRAYMREYRRKPAATRTPDDVYMP